MASNFVLGRRICQHCIHYRDLGLTVVGYCMREPVQSKCTKFYVDRESRCAYGEFLEGQKSPTGAHRITDVRGNATGWYHEP